MAVVQPQTGPMEDRIAKVALLKGMRKDAHPPKQRKNEKKYKKSDYSMLWSMM